MARKRTGSAPSSIRTADLRSSAGNARRGGASHMEANFSQAARISKQVSSGRGGRPSGNASAAARRTVTVRPSAKPAVARSRNAMHVDAKEKPRKMAAVEAGSARGRHRGRQLATGRGAKRTGGTRQMEGVTAANLDKDLDAYMMSK